MQTTNLRTVGIGALLLCLIALTACGGSSSSDTPPPTATDAEWNATNWNEGDWQ